jgi:hypothetical protein
VGLTRGAGDVGLDGNARRRAVNNGFHDLRKGPAYHRRVLHGPDVDGFELD